MVLPPANQPNVAQLAYLMDLAADEAARQRAIVRARAYHAGNQFVRLDERLRAFLKDSRGGRDSDFLRLNVCRIVVSAVSERLSVQQLACVDEASALAANQWWTANQLEILQDDIHIGTLRDGESFLVLGWDEAGYPCIVPHPRYTDPQIESVALGGSTPTKTNGLSTGSQLASETLTHPESSGDGFGVKAFYPDDDSSQPMSFATKTWTEVTYKDGARTSRRRLTIYYPDRIEKYALGASLTPISDDDDTSWPVPWVDRNGQPLGIPVIHVRNADLQCEAWEAIPLQNVINKFLIDLVAASDLTAFRILAAFGWMPTTDGQALKADKSNQLKLQPGTFVGTTSKEGRLEAINGADLEGFETSINAVIAWTAMVTDTPVSRFVFTRQVASDKTLKEQEGPLIIKVGKRQILIGSAYVQAFTLARKLHNTFSGQAQLQELAPYTVQWVPAEQPDEEAELAALGNKRTILEIPLETLWAEAGYSAEQITQMKILRAAERAAMMPSLPATTTPTMSGQSSDSGAMS